MIYYVIANESGYYIRKDEYSNKYVPIRNKNMAERWNQRAKAVNVLNNALSKTIRGSYKIIEIQENDEQSAKPDIQYYIKANESVASAITSEVYEDDLTGKWSAGINSMAEFVMDAEQRKEVLVQKLSEVDKEISDINHYIEFGKFNAYQGWLAFSMLRHRLRKRRKIKNELQVIQQLGDSKITSSMLQAIKKSIAELDNRKYTPRVLSELFEQPG